MHDVLNIDFLIHSRVPVVNQSFVFLDHKNVILTHNIFIGVCILYMPLIIVINILVFWGIVLYPGFHTTNNYLLLSLSIADFLMGAYCIPLNILSYLRSTRATILANKHACLLLFASKQLAGSGSLLCLFTISVDRYIAVTWPFKYPYIVNERRIVRLIVFQWTVLVFLSLLPMMGLNNYNPKVQPLILRCNYFMTLTQEYVLAYLVFTSAAISISAALHIRIIIIAIRQVSRFRYEMTQLTREQIFQFQNRVNSVKLTSFLMLVFVILYLPYVLISPFKYLNLFSEVSIEIIQVIAQLFTFGNSLANGPIYAIARTEYRKVYLAMLTSLPWRWKSVLRNLHREQHSSMYSYDASNPDSPRADRLYSLKTLSDGASGTLRSVGVVSRDSSEESVVHGTKV